MHVCSVFGHKQPQKPPVHPNKQADPQTQWITHDSLAINGPRSVLSFPIRSAEGTKYVCCEWKNELPVMLHLHLVTPCLLFIPSLTCGVCFHAHCGDFRAYMHILFFCLFMWTYQELEASPDSRAFLDKSNWERFQKPKRCIHFSAYVCGRVFIHMLVTVSSCVPGQHRSLGPSISKVRSLKLDSSIWSNALVEVRTVCCSFY